MSLPFLDAPKDGKELLMADVTRVLSMVLGNLWLQELSSEIGAFRLTLDRATAFSDEELNDSITALKALNMITTQDGIRADIGKPKRDLLVALVRSEPLQNSLRSDPDLRRYRTISWSYLH